MSTEQIEAVRGWPRPRARCIADQVDMLTPSVKPGRPATRPVPWVAATDRLGGWHAVIFDEPRAELMRRDDLCQVCGDARGPIVYALGCVDQAYPRSLTHAAQFGGALCSVRCARLSAAECPHYIDQWPVGVFAVPNGARVALNDAEYASDDEFDLSEVAPVSVIGGAS